MYQFLHEPKRKWLRGLSNSPALIILKLLLLVDLVYIRIHSINFLTIMLAMGFFGVFMDLVHEIIDIRYIYGLISVAEDGGEMISVSFFTAYAFLLVQSKG